ncbi:hypothetical protein JMJ77_0011544 [Colletotrichum scovillei]|uniref:Uncharacterized protein n=1 Tax=Colletotrichum scovillei TaxID=1209932 RepID=A0A9P7UD54_9PEZI|nr:hypothetical protein JMJ77_0011544 [Colletotrichum scovillei]KAG7045826.1 hypothetical protein JMJ78_0010897 [Colletotrichum scovillei]KAG7063170.1 hypothetical protein JMJ76_0005638 [Colletotrichum scovillei]
MAEKKSGDKADSRPTISSAPSRRSGGKAESRTGSPCTSAEDILPTTDSGPRIHAYSKIRHKVRLSDARAKRGSPSLQMAFDFSGAVRNIRPKPQVSNPPHRKCFSSHPCLPFSRREILPEAQAKPHTSSGLNVS